jgi:Glycosyltransferase
MGKADVFAFSVRAEEGLGIALVEAMAAGLPVVATDVGACREVLDNGRCGLLVPAADPDRLAGALEQAALRPDPAQLRRARSRAAARYSREAMAEGYARVLRL